MGRQRGTPDWLVVLRRFDNNIRGQKVKRRQATLITKP
jgi:hypothetical protein